MYRDAQEWVGGGGRRNLMNIYIHCMPIREPRKGHTLLACSMVSNRSWHLLVIPHISSTANFKYRPMDFSDFYKLSKNIQEMSHYEREIRMHNLTMKEICFLAGSLNAKGEQITIEIYNFFLRIGLYRAGS